MRRAWVGLALLSASWLFALSYYHDADSLVWVVLIVGGTGLLYGVGVPKPGWGGLVAAALLLVPAAVLAPWPYRAAMLLVFAGALLSAAPIPRRWPARLGSAAVAGGTVLLVQSLGLLFYESVTAKSHELPQPLAYGVYAVAKLLGIDAALHGSTVALHSMRRVHPLGATWELLLDPATLCFLLGGVALLCLSRGRRPQQWSLSLPKSLAVLLVSVAIWLPARVGILMAVFMHRALRTEYDATLNLMGQFWSPWVHLFLLAGPGLLAVCLVRGPARVRANCGASSGTRLSGRLIPAALAFFAALLLTGAILWDPPGRRKGGRILVDEHRSTWERTDRPYDTDWYGHESGYNYACIYDYCSRFYEMDRLNETIDANALTDCDVLVIKVPTARYEAAEIDEIERFVERGGGLLLVGEHTNVFNTGTYLNDVAARFGLRFRYDCLFDIDTVFTQLYEPPLVPHPIVQHMPAMDFAVSCSLDPGTSQGRAVIRGKGLRSLPADYHASNFYPQVEDRAEARYGAFVQLWTMRCGAGRVVAFTDSTIFSNFSTFEPGKPELMLGMLEWLNHRNTSWDARPLLIALGVLSVVCALVLARKWQGAWLVLLGAAACGWCVGAVGAGAMHRRAMPPPVAVRPFTHVVIDRTICDVPLSKSGFIAGKENGFGIFERWILRLGWFTSRRRGPQAFRSDLIVFAYPTGPVSREFREALDAYVTAGGHALVLDSPANTASTANILLHPFGLRLDHATQTKGVLTVPQGWPAVAVDSACAVEGAAPLISIGQTPVAATARYGQGTVTVLGFGSRFSDTKMGVTGDVVPGETLRDVFELQFTLLRSLLPDAP